MERTAVASRTQPGRYLIRVWDGTLLRRLWLYRHSNGRWTLYEGPEFIGWFHSKRRCLQWLETKS